MADGQTPNTSTEETEQQIAQYLALGRTVAKISRHLLEERINKDSEATNAFVTIKMAVSRTAAADLDFIETAGAGPFGCCIAPISCEETNFDKTAIEDDWAAFKQVALAAGVGTFGWPQCDDC